MNPNLSLNTINFNGLNLKVKIVKLDCFKSPTTGYLQTQDTRYIENNRMNTHKVPQIY